MVRSLPGQAPHFTFAPYLQDVTENGVVIMWATDVMTTGVVRVFDALPTSRQPGTDANAPVGELPGSEPGFEPEQQPLGVFISPPGTHHRVRLTGLKPGTRYRYVVAARRPGLGDAGAQEAAMPLVDFATASTRGPFNFLVYGDNRDRDADHASVIQAMLSESPDFVLQTGDMVSRASDEGQWRRYFATAWPLLRSAPLYPVLGNHELRFEPDAGHFHRLFSLPFAAQRRRPVYYAFRYNNSLFLAIDGNSPYDQDQAAWLERTLHAHQNSPDIRHTFVFVHQPPFAVGAYCGSERLVRRVVPILQHYKIRAVFAGHEHAYQHLERDGIRYFISGGGGAPLYTRSQACNFEDDQALRLFRAEHHYLKVQVDGDAATLLAINRQGELIERVPLNEPVHENPLPLPPVDEERAWPPRPHEAPLLALSATSPPPAAVARGSGSASSSGTGPLLILWLSSIAILAGLLMLTRDLRRRS